jgi:hypothetical protein
MVSTSRDERNSLATGRMQEDLESVLHSEEDLRWAMKPSSDLRGDSERVVYVDE